MTTSSSAISIAPHIVITMLTPAGQVFGTRDGWTVRVRCGAASRVPHPREGCPSCGGSVQAERPSWVDDTIGMLDAANHRARCAAAGREVT
jgi:hypothetical protein